MEVEKKEAAKDLESGCLYGSFAGNAYASQTVSTNSSGRQPMIEDAQWLALRDVVHNATLFVRARREFSPSADHGAFDGHQTSTKKLIKESVNANAYVRASKKVPMIPLIANALDEPDNANFIDMLLGLTAVIRINVLP